MALNLYLRTSRDEVRLHMGMIEIPEVYAICKRIETSGIEGEDVVETDWQFFEDPDIGAAGLEIFVLYGES